MSLTNPSAAILKISDISEGMTAAFEKTILEKDIDGFAALTGDYSPLHMESAFARARGFSGRVAHGVLICGYLSRLFGMYLPGSDCLLQSTQIKWLRPCCAGDTISLSAIVVQVSPVANAVVAEVKVVNTETDEVLAKGKVQFGFTQPTT